MNMIPSIPLPPMCELPDPLKVVSGEQITWLLHDDSRHSGTLIDYHSETKEFIVLAKGETANKAIATDTVKLMTLATMRPYLLQGIAKKVRVTP